MIFIFFPFLYEKARAAAFAKAPLRSFLYGLIGKFFIAGGQDAFAPESGLKSGLKAVLSRPDFKELTV
jgi:hypothetical protein